MAENSVNGRLVCIFKVPGSDFGGVDISTRSHVLWHNHGPEARLFSEKPGFSENLPAAGSRLQQTVVRQRLSALPATRQY